MNGTKMSKNFFFQMIEKRLYELASEVETVKKDESMSFEEKLAQENILFGRLLELNSINFSARDVDYWRYIELEKKIKAVRDSI